MADLIEKLKEIDVVKKIARLLLAEEIKEYETYLYFAYHELKDREIRPALQNRIKRLLKNPDDGPRTRIIFAEELATGTITSEKITVPPLIEPKSRP